MARMIYPGVYVLDVPQTPEYRQSKAGKYTDIYTNQRYENWQTSLQLAELQYKTQYDAYTAKAKATKELVDDIDRQIKDQTDTTRRLESSILDNSQKTKMKLAADETARSARVYAQAQANARAAAHNKAISGIYITADQDKTAALTTASQTAGAYREGRIDVNNMTSALGQSTRKDGAPPTAEEQMATAAAALKKMAQGDPVEGVSEEARILQISREITRADPKTLGPIFQGALMYTGASDANAPGSIKVAPDSYKVFTPSIEPEQAYRLAQIEALRGTDYARMMAENVLGFKDWKVGVKPGDPDYVSGSMKEGAEQKTKAMIDQAETRAPNASGIVDEARGIYGSKFESLPAYEKKKALDETKVYLDKFIAWKLSKLPEDASNEQVLAARNEAISDAMYYAKNKELPKRDDPETVAAVKAVMPATGKAATEAAMAAAAKGMRKTPIPLTADDDIFKESLPTEDETTASNTAPTKKTVKEEDFTHALHELASAKDLVNKPKKAARLLNNTPVGKTVTDLWDSNERLDEPKDWIALRTTIVDTFGDDIKARDEALRLMAYRFQLQDRSGKALTPTSKTA